MYNCFPDTGVAIEILGYNHLFLDTTRLWKVSSFAIASYNVTIVSTWGSCAS